MASTLEKVTQERNDKNSSQRRSNKASYLKSDAELKKIFGITKDLRVYLTRIAQQLGSGEGFDSISPLVKSETYKEAEFIVKEEGRKQVIDFIYFPFFYYYFLLYNIVLVLPYINMHLPRVGVQDGEHVYV